MEIINVIQVDDIEMKMTAETTAVKEGKAEWDNDKGCYVTTQNQSPRKMCWRCVHVKGEIVALLESDGLTETIWDMFCGTSSEVKAEIERLNLKIPFPWDEEFEKLNGVEAIE